MLVFVTLNIKNSLTCELNIFLISYLIANVFYFLLVCFFHWWPRYKISSFPLEVQESKNWTLKGLLNDPFISTSFTKFPLPHPEHPSPTAHICKAVISSIKGHCFLAMWNPWAIMKSNSVHFPFSEKKRH